MSCTDRLIRLLFRLKLQEPKTATVSFQSTSSTDLSRHLNTLLGFTALIFRRLFKVEVEPKISYLLIQESM